MKCIILKLTVHFPKEKRPIILDLAGKMSANRIKNTAPKKQFLFYKKDS